MIRGIEHMIDEERKREMDLFSAEVMWLGRRESACYNQLTVMSCHKEESNRLQILVVNDKLQRDTGIRLAWWVLVMEGIQGCLLWRTAWGCLCAQWRQCQWLQVGPTNQVGLQVVQAPTWPPLAKVEPVIVSDGASVMAHVKRENKFLQQAASEEKSMWEIKLCRHQKKCRRKGKKCSRHHSTDSPSACGADNSKAAMPLQPAPTCPWWSRDPPQPMDIPTLEKVNVDAQDDHALKEHTVGSRHSFQLRVRKGPSPMVFCSIMLIYLSSVFPIGPLALPTPFTYPMFIC